MPTSSWWYCFAPPCSRSLRSRSATWSSDVPAYALMVGVPARRVGWMCQCGERVSLSGGRGACPACGTAYEESTADPVPGMRQLRDRRLELGDGGPHDELLGFDDRLERGQDLVLDGAVLGHEVQQRHVHLTLRDGAATARKVPPPPDSSYAVPHAGHAPRPPESETRSPH